MATALKEEEVLVGGQAVIEGVMMRTPNAYAVAVRTVDGGVAVKKGVVCNLSQRYPLLGRPLLRGVATLFQALALGIRTLNYSASIAIQNEAREGDARNQNGNDATTWAIVGSMGVALALGVGVFVVAPLYLTKGAALYFPALQSWVVFNLVDGLIRLILFVAYLVAISRMRDIKRVFEYHGAEHKVVLNREAQEALTVENARRFSRFHPRCGTSFLLFVMVVSILVFSIFKFRSFYLILLSRIFLIPLIAGLSYEIIRFSARTVDRTWCRLLIQPGLWLQRLTTREPSDDQLQVAIRALEEALKVEKEVLVSVEAA